MSVNLQGICISKPLLCSIPPNSQIESFPAKANRVHTYPSLARPDHYPALQQPDLLKAAAVVAKKKGTLTLEKDNIVFDAVPVGKSQVMKVNIFLKLTYLHQGFICFLYLNIKHYIAQISSMMQDIPLEYLYKI